MLFEYFENEKKGKENGVCSQIDVCIIKLMLLSYY